MDYFWNILASQDGPELLGLLAVAAAKATLLVAFAALLTLTLRRLSAATRHLLWASTLCAALLLPFLSFINVWEMPILPARASVADSSLPQEASASDEFSVAESARKAPVSARSAAASESAQNVGQFTGGAGSFNQAAPTVLPRLVNWALAVWAVGVLLLLIRLLVGLAATGLLARRAVEFKDPALAELFSSLLAEVGLKSSVRLLRSDRTSMPVVCGILRPAVLLPAEAESWPEEQRRLVLLHELTHVARRDCLTQMIAQAACAVYWFNPLIWTAARRLRVERERACDDYVLSVGTRPSDYAHHLLEIARSTRERAVFRWSQTASVAMARRSQLEGRLLAILSKEHKHGAVSRAAAAGLLALVCVLFVSLAVVRPTASSAERQAVSKETHEGEAGNSLADTAAGATWDATVNQTAEAGEQGSTDTVVAHAQEQAPTDERVEEQAAEPSVEPDAEQLAAQPPPPPLPLPGSDGPIRPGAFPFPGVQFGHENKNAAQDGSGDFIDEMASVGLTNLSVDELIALKSSGVTADYVKGLRALGFSNLAMKELIAVANNDVTPEYIKSIRAAGYNDLSLKEMLTFRIHDITPEFIKALKDAGYGNLPSGQLIQFAVHEVDPAFIAAMRALGFSNLPPRDLVSLRVHDITPAFIRKARSKLGELSLQ
ncbi:MAG TPA: M56 family metallopeptidase, partial [Pyrinomonadaceae bacterium]|nr:M56 family metallopeptidase [Pyrinomonadaceae bacterium]